MEPNRIRAVILDDELHSIETMQWKIQHYCPELEVVATFDDPLKAIEYLRANPPDLLFLDIEMPMLNGFDVLEELGQAIQFEVIFTTAYDQFGIQAVRASALDYLLKPVQNKELQRAVERFREQGGRRSAAARIGGLLANVQSAREGRPGKVALATRESIEFVGPEEIVLCMSDSNYTMVHLADGRKKLLSRTLKDIEEMLVPFAFFRPHHSYLINLDMVREVIRGDGGYLLMQNQMKVPIAKNRRDDLMRVLMA